MKKITAIIFAILVLSTVGVASANVQGADLAVRNVNYDHNANIGQVVDFTVFVKNMGNEPTETIFISIEFGDGSGAGFAAPVAIQPGETRSYTFSSLYNQPGKYTIKLNANTDGDVNLENNMKESKLIVV